MQTYLVIQSDSANWALIVAPDSVKAMDAFNARFANCPAGAAWPIDDGQVGVRLNDRKKHQGVFLGHWPYTPPAYYRGDDHRDIFKADDTLLVSCFNVEDSEFVLKALLAYKEP